MTTTSQQSLIRRPPWGFLFLEGRAVGVASRRRCVAEPGPLRESIEVASSHLGIGWHPVALLTIADRLAQPEGAWTPCRAPKPWRRPFAPRMMTTYG